MNIKSKLIANIVMYGAIASFFAPVGVVGFLPQFPFWLAVFLSAAIGIPLLIISMQLQESSHRTPADGIEDSGLHATNANAPKPFWPTRTEIWGYVGFFTFLACVFGPCILFLPLFFLLPAGDNWWIVIVRISLAIIVCGAYYLWIEYARKTIPNFFRGKVSDATLDAALKEEPRKEPGSAMEAALMNWQLLVFVVVAFLVAYGFLNFKNPGPILERGPRRLQGFVRFLTWCRGNPNTVMSSSVLVGLGGLALYMYRVIRAHVRSNSE
jgi:hypothetical protein